MAVGCDVIEMVYKMTYLVFSKIICKERQQLLQLVERLLGVGFGSKFFYIG